MTQILIITAIAMIADVLTGVAGAVKTGTLKSGKMREGLWHKAGFCGLIVLGFILEYAAGLADIGINVPATNAVCIWVLMTEAVSISENLCILSPQIAESPIGKVLAEHKAENEKQEI